MLDSDDDPSIKEKNVNLIKNNEIFVKKWKKRDDYLKDPKVLKEALDEYEKLLANYGTYGDVGYYFYLRSAQDQNNPKIKAKLKKQEDISIKISNDIDFFTHGVSKIPEPAQQKFLESPDLAEYKHFLEQLFTISRYLLSEEEEKILSLTSMSGFGNWVRMTSDFLSGEEKIVLDEDNKKRKKSFAELLALLKSKKKKVRDESAKALNQIFEKYVDVGEHELNSILNYKKVIDELKGFDRPDRARHVTEDIDTEVVDALIDSVTADFETPKKYYELKAKLLGLKKLGYHERVVEYGNIDKKFSYDESVEMVSRAFSKLDPEFDEIFTGMVDNGKVDVFPKKGKSDGAFCVSILKTQPIYVLLNHNGTLHDVITIAH